MPNVENQSVKSSRDRLIDSMSSRFPDRRFRAESADNAEGVEVDDLEQSVLDLIDNLDKVNNENMERNKRMTDLYSTDPFAARFSNGWLESGSPFVGLAKIIGTQRFREVMDSPNVQEKLTQIAAEENAHIAEDDRLREERSANWANSLSMLDDFAAKHNLDEDARVNLLLEYIQMADDAYMGKFTEQGLTALLNARNYQNDVTAARHEGEVAGRNQTIQNKLRQSRPSGTMPPSLSGVSAGAGEPQPRQESEADKVKKMFGITNLK